MANPAAAPAVLEKLTGKLLRVRVEKGTWFAGVLEQPGDTPTAPTVQINISGPCFEIPPLESDIEIAGAWTDDPKWGKQFKFTWLKVTPPSTREGVLRYLCTLPNIGPTRAEAIYAQFGDASLDRIAADPSCLASVKGIGSRAVEIGEDINRRASAREVELILCSMNFGERTREKIREEFGPSLLNVLRDDPYQLVRVDGISFHKVDTAVLALGVIPAHSPKRAAAALCQAIKDHTSEGGHTWLADHELIPALGKLRLSQPVPIDAQIAGRNHALKVESIVAVNHPAHGPGYSIPSLATAEDRAATKLQSLLANGPEPFGSLENIPEDMRAALAPEQRAAVEKAILHRVCVLTGGPGTGKTYATRAIIAAYASDEVAILAPTGKAAKRASEMTGRKASTIHKFVMRLRIGSSDEGEEESRQPRVVIVDEASMVDAATLWMLLDALRRPDLRIVFVGDVDQLPSIGPGSVLADLLRCGVVPITRLSTIQRQAAGSRIITNAHKINRGEIPDNSPASREDWFFLQGKADGSDVNVLVERVVGMITRARARWGYDPRRDIQVLSGQKKSALGVDALNAAIRESLNPSRPGEFEITGKDGVSLFRRGDKVLCTSNDYKLGVVNGDVGEVTDVLPARNGADGTKLPQAVDVRLDGTDAGDGEEAEVVRFAGDQIWLLVQAWAMTVHKSQGSEYKMVIVAAHTCMAWALQKALLYTAITRGKERVAIIGTQKAVAMAVRKTDTSNRNTRFAYLLNPMLGKVTT